MPVNFYRIVWFASGVVNTLVFQYFILPHLF